MESTDRLEVGDYACFTWKKLDGSALGASEGLFLGCFGDEISGKFLVFDKSCYNHSFKTELFSLGISDLKVVPFDEIDRVNRRGLRERPPNLTENVTFLLDAVFVSNIDYEATINSVKKAYSALKPKIIGNEYADYGLVISGIPSIEEATINITRNGKIQITCPQALLDNCIFWLETSVKLPPDQKRLVLFPKYANYRIGAHFKEKVIPSETLVNQIGKTEGSVVVVPIGWEQQFLKESDRTALSDVLENENSATPSENTCQSRKSDLTVHKYLGNKTRALNLAGQILNLEQEKGLMEMWEKSRSDVSQGFDSGPMTGGRIKAQVIIQEIAINRKTGQYTTVLRPYYTDQFNKVTPQKGVRAKLKTNHANKG